MNARSTIAISLAALLTLAGPAAAAPEGKGGSGGRGGGGISAGPRGGPSPGARSGGNFRAGPAIRHSGPSSSAARVQRRAPAMREGRSISRDRAPARDRVIVGRGDGDRRPHRRHRGTRYVWGSGATFWFYDGYYHGDCSWLRRKAIATGSRFWWRRYRQCRDWD